MTASNRSLLQMPPGFLWGVATAAHQNEGDNHNNQWTAWEAGPGHIRSDGRCGRANHWWDLAEAVADFDRAADLGLNSLRLSVEWSRIEPQEGVFDEAALARYCEMVRLLRERGLTPMVTLHHFTDPLWLAQRGGWENPQVGDFFGRFVRRTVEALGDQVHLWCTINEPFVYAYFGYLQGTFPPGAHSLPRAARVLRQMLLAHGRAYRLIHACQNEAQVGLAHNFQVMLPANPASAADRRATALLDQMANASTLEAVLHGRLTPIIGWGQTVASLIDTMDYIGLNYYSTMRVAFDPTRPASLFARQFYDAQGEVSEPTKDGHPYGEINSQGLYLALKRLALYRKPIYVTENGVPDRDDIVRPRFLATHLAEAWRAVQEGVDLRGFYWWTLVDNFEWAEGWDLKFGLFAMDRETGERTPKTSAAIYSRIAAANGIPRTLLQQVAPGTADRYFEDSV